LTGAALLSANGSIRAAETQTPNIVFFLVDDLGKGDISAFGSTFHETPHIDQLCGQGMKFTQAYSACTVCSPSRAAILTGCYPARLHLTDWIPGKKVTNPKLSMPDWQMYIDHERVTLPEALGAGGYDSLFVGKWHLMPNNQPKLFAEYTPEKHGFGGNVGGREWGQPRGPGKYFFPWGLPNLDGGEKGDFLTDALTDKAVDYVDRMEGKPFLLYLSYYAVHEPVMCKPEDEEYFRKKLEAAPEGTYTQTNPKYAGLVKAVDDSVGRIVDALRAKGQLDNTVFIFTGDNGGLPPSSSGGLRGTKATEFEGGIAEPTFVVWPGVTKPGSECAVPIIGTDFYPTLLEIAGLPLLPDQHRDGLSLVPLLKQNGPFDRDSLYWHYPHYHKTTPYGAIRSKDWKLIELFEDGSLMLFDLKNDPNETRDLSKQYPEKAQELLVKMQAWRKAVDAQMPTPNPKYDPDKDGAKKGGKKK
jgi:arylsulfatase A-like enzyme